jgi:structural maintenance of chromosome 2
MFVQEVIIDGFKSYAARTVISGWDPQFNAITGLNGSGKSNILDAICFVLGISNLSQVRASNLQDLVYKQGQAGVTKATVSIVFSNNDVKQSPIGYEACETITVTRQVNRRELKSTGAAAAVLVVARVLAAVPPPESTPRRPAARPVRPGPQVVIGGRNKYLINGKNVQQGAVQNLFHSVQLNVNNPHFLIMQVSPAGGLERGAAPTEE